MYYTQQYIYGDYTRLSTGKTEKSVMTSSKQGPLTEYQSRIKYLKAQGRLMERHLQSESQLSAKDVADLEIIIKHAIAANDYTLNELEGLRIKKGRIYGRVNVTSIKTDNGNMQRHHTATITFHTDHAYSVVFDDHKIGGDEWCSYTKTVPGHNIKFTHGKMYFNDNPPFEFSKGAQTYLVKQFFPAGKPIHKSLLINNIVSTINGANYDSDDSKREIRKTYLNARKALNKTFMAETGAKEELIELFGDEDTGQTRLQINPKFIKK